MYKLGIATWASDHTFTAVDSWPEIDPADLRPDAAERLDPPVAELEALGCGVVAFGSIPQLGDDQRHHAVLLLSTDRMIGIAVTDYVKGAYLETTAGLTTRFHDGTYGVTFNAPIIFTHPTNQVRDYCPGLSAGEAFARHRANLVRWETEGRRVGTFEPREAAVEAARLSRDQAEHLEDRGIMVRLTEDEIAERRASMRQE